MSLPTEEHFTKVGLQFFTNFTKTHKPDLVYTRYKGMLAWKDGKTEEIICYTYINEFTSEEVFLIRTKVLDINKDVENMKAVLDPSFVELASCRKHRNRTNKVSTLHVSSDIPASVRYLEELQAVEIMLPHGYKILMGWNYANEVFDKLRTVLDDHQVL